LACKLPKRRHAALNLGDLRVQMPGDVAGNHKSLPSWGFTHYCGKTRKGNFRIKRRTSRKKFAQSLREFTEWAFKSRSVLRKGEMLRRAKVRIDGHLNYYAITDNLWKCSAYRHYATKILFKWLNRKSQRRAYT